MKRVLIIGATSAIACATARKWATKHSEFFLVARDQKKLQLVSADLQSRGAGKVTLHVMDATDIDAHAPMLEASLAALGQIDVVLIAHGTLPDQRACEENTQTALKEFANNGTSVIALLTVIANHMAIQRWGTLAVISSVAGDRGRPSNYLYGAAKAAVTTFCEGLRARLFKVGVHVITIKPGFVATPMTQGLKLPKALVVNADTVATIIVEHIDKKTNVLYVPRFWLLIMTIVRCLPQFIFKKINL